MSRECRLRPRTGHPPERVWEHPAGRCAGGDRDCWGGSEQDDASGLRGPPFDGVEVTLEPRVAFVVECRGLAGREPLRVVGLWLVSGEFDPSLPAHPRAHLHTAVLLWGCPRSPALSPDAHRTVP